MYYIFTLDFSFFSLYSIIVNQIGDPNFSNVKIPPIISAKNHVKGFNIVDFDPLASERERSSLIPVMDITIII